MLPSLPLLQLFVSYALEIDTLKLASNFYKLYTLVWAFRLDTGIDYNSYSFFYAFALLKLLQFKWRKSNLIKLNVLFLIVFLSKNDIHSLHLNIATR